MYRTMVHAHVHPLCSSLQMAWRCLYENQSQDVSDIHTYMYIVQTPQILRNDNIILYKFCT